MDKGGAIFRTTKVTAGVPPELIGKWIQSAISGEFFVNDIQKSIWKPVPLSRFLLYHYIIGILLTFIFSPIISVFKITQL